jgi:hypothetical protein
VTHGKRDVRSRAVATTLALALCERRLMSVREVAHAAKAGELPGVRRRNRVTKRHRRWRLGKEVVAEALEDPLGPARDAGVIVDSFDEQKNQPLYAYRNLAITVRGDVALVRVTVSPVTGINYIEITEVLQLPVLRA